LLLWWTPGLLQRQIPSLLLITVLGSPVTSIKYLREKNKRKEAENKGKSRVLISIESWAPIVIASSSVDSVDGCHCALEKVILVVEDDAGKDSVVSLPNCHYGAYI
jgi:hypothetical protein